MSKSLLNLLLIVTIAAAYYLVINPLYTGSGGVWQPAQSVQSLRELDTQYDVTLAQADTLYSEAQTLQAQYANVSDDQKQKMSVMVPDSVDKIRLLDEVSGIAAQAGLTFENLAYSEGTVAPSGLGSAGISFTVKTTYPKFKELMDDFEKSLRLYSIQSVSFSAPGKEGDPTSYQVKLTTFYMN
jgi:hypothetical protein